MTKIKRSQEDFENLMDILGHDGLPVLLRELGYLVEATENAMIKLSSEDEKQLVRAKCKAEGARKLLLDFTQHLKTLKPKQNA